MSHRISTTLQNFWKGKYQLYRHFATKQSSAGNNPASNKSNEGSASKGGSTVNVPSKKIVTQLPPLTESLPDLPVVEYATPKPEDNQTQVTVLSNGLRVASEKRFGQFCTIGVVIDSGPRYEVAYPSGVSHFLEKLAFNSTINYPNKDCILKELEQHGGIVDCQSSRDTLIYAASIDSRAVTSVTRLLADVTLRPQISDEEVNLARQTIQFELESLGMRPEQEPILMDMIHAAAFRDNTLGLPKLCPENNIKLIDRTVLLNYLKYHHSPRRMVVAGVGVDHNALVDSVKQFFVNEKPIWETEVLPKCGADSIDRSTAQYTGGIRKEECDIPIYAAAGLPELAHIVIGLEGTSHQDPDFVSLCVLNIMMGGGGSFSAGGPGKGMYTRLYTNVLNRYHWMYSATAYNHAYSDTGLFCIHASAPPNNVKEMVEVISRELVNMATEPGKQELRRAKTQLQSMLLMNLESRPVVFEDIGRQVLATGTRKRSEHFIQEIEKVTASDVQRIARRILATPPSLAARGNIDDLPELKNVQKALINDGRFSGSKRLSLFR